MLQGAITDLLNPLVPKAHNSGWQNLSIPLQMKPVKLQLKLVCGFFFTLGTNGLSAIGPIS